MPQYILLSQRLQAGKPARGGIVTTIVKHCAGSTVANQGSDSHTMSSSIRGCRPGRLLVALSSQPAIAAESCARLCTHQQQIM
jgi:hypothetical protein